MEATRIGRGFGRQDVDLFVPHFMAFARLAAPYHVAALIPQDLKEPRPERPSDVEAVKGLPSLDERIL
jgi:hypothetical protein